MYKGKKTDLVGRGVKAAEIKDRDATPSKPKKKKGNRGLVN